MIDNNLMILEAKDEHFDDVWEIFHSIVSVGDSYVYDPNTTKEQARDIWYNPHIKTFVALHEGKLVGTYVIKPNFPGLGSHIANCSYMVSSKARGLGVGRKMAEHSLVYAKEHGFVGMQFNIVVSTNEIAVRLWQSLGFNIIGTTPKAFRHKTLGLVDTYIMYREI